MTDPPALTAVHHVTLTVADLARAADWYTRVLGCVVVTSHEQPDFDRVILRVPGVGTLLGLSARHDVNRARLFDPEVVGLDHLSFAVASRADLDAWAARLTDLGVSHSGVKDATTPGYMLVACRDPDGIQLEFFYSPPIGEA